MPDVLIRDVPADDLEQIRAAAAASGSSLQGYLRDTLRGQAAHLRRQQVLARTADRLHGSVEVPDAEREAVLEAVDTAHSDRSEQLADR